MNLRRGGRSPRASDSWRRGRYDEALAPLAEPIRLDPDRTRGYLLPAEATFRRGDLAAAVADFDEVIRRDPGHLLALINRGTALAGLRRYDDALADLGRAIEVAPEEAHDHRRDLHPALRRAGPGEAVRPRLPGSRAERAEMDSEDHALVAGGSPGRSDGQERCSGATGCLGGFLAMGTQEAGARVRVLARNGGDGYHRGPA